MGLPGRRGSGGACSSLRLLPFPSMALLALIALSILISVHLGTVEGQVAYQDGVQDLPDHFGVDAEAGDYKAQQITETGEPHGQEDTETGDNYDEESEEAEEEDYYGQQASQLDEDILNVLEHAGVPAYQGPTQDDGEAAATYDYDTLARHYETMGAQTRQQARFLAQVGEGTGGEGEGEGSRDPGTEGLAGGETEQDAFSHKTVPGPQGTAGAEGSEGNGPSHLRQQHQRLLRQAEVMEAVASVYRTAALLTESPPNPGTSRGVLEASYYRAIAHLYRQEARGLGPESALGETYMQYAEQYESAAWASERGKTSFGGGAAEGDSSGGSFEGSGAGGAGTGGASPGVAGQGHRQPKGHGPSGRRDGLGQRGGEGREEWGRESREHSQFPQYSTPDQLRLLLASMIELYRRSSEAITPHDPTLNSDPATERSRKHLLRRVVDGLTGLEAELAPILGTREQKQVAFPPGLTAPEALARVYRGVGAVFRQVAAEARRLQADPALRSPAGTGGSKGMDVGEGGSGGVPPAAYQGVESSLGLFAQDLDKTAGDYERMAQDALNAQAQGFQESGRGDAGDAPGDVHGGHYAEGQQQQQLEEEDGGRRGGAMTKGESAESKSAPVAWEPPPIRGAPQAFQILSTLLSLQGLGPWSPHASLPEPNPLPEGSTADPGTAPSDGSSYFKGGSSAGPEGLPQAYQEGTSAGAGGGSRQLYPQARGGEASTVYPQARGSEASTVYPLPLQEVALPMRMALRMQAVAIALRHSLKGMAADWEHRQARETQDADSKQAREHPQEEAHASRGTGVPDARAQQEPGEGALLGGKTVLKEEKEASSTWESSDGEGDPSALKDGTPSHLGWHSGAPREDLVYGLLERVAKQLEKLAGHYLGEYFTLASREGRQQRFAQEQQWQQQQQHQQQHQQQQQPDISPLGVVVLTEQEAAVRLGQLYRALAAHFRHILLTWKAEVQALSSGHVSGPHGHDEQREVYAAEREMEHLAINFDVKAAKFERLAQQGSSGASGAGPGHTLVPPSTPDVAALLRHGPPLPEKFPGSHPVYRGGSSLGAPGLGNAEAGAGYSGGVSGVGAEARGGGRPPGGVPEFTRKDLSRVVDMLYAERSKRNVARAVEELLRLAAPLAHWLSSNAPTYPWVADKPPAQPGVLARPGGHAGGHGDSSNSNSAGDTDAQAGGSSGGVSLEGSAASDTARPGSVEESLAGAEGAAARARENTLESEGGIARAQEGGAVGAGGGAATPQGSAAGTAGGAAPGEAEGSALASGGAYRLGKEGGAAPAEGAALGSGGAQGLGTEGSQLPAGWALKRRAPAGAPESSQADVPGGLQEGGESSQGDVPRVLQEGGESEEKEDEEEEGGNGEDGSSSGGAGDDQAGGMTEDEGTVEREEIPEDASAGISYDSPASESLASDPSAVDPPASEPSSSEATPANPDAKAASTPTDSGAKAVSTPTDSDAKAASPPPIPPPPPAAPGAGAVPTGSAADSWPRDVSQWLSKETVEVSSDAMFLLAVVSSTGIASRVVPKDDARAVAELLVAAETGSMQAVVALGNRYITGRGLPQNCPHGAHYLRAVAEKLFQDASASGNTLVPRESVGLRDVARDGAFAPDMLQDDLPDEVDLDEDLALRGVPEYQRQMGYRQLVGQGVEQNPENAWRNFQAAAAAGDEVAMFNLGYMHMKGVGRPVNYSLAHSYFTRAVRRRPPLAAALNGLGVLHFNGWGVPVNYSLAATFFKAAGDRRDPDALFNLGSMYYNGLGVLANASRAVDHFQRAMDEGHWQAPFTLAEIYHVGAPGIDAFSTVAPNCSRAGRLFNIFISERSTWAKDLKSAALAYQAGDHWSALFRYLLVSEEGSRLASENAALLVAKGRGYKGPGRHALALALYERAVAVNSTAAMVDAALLHLRFTQGGPGHSEGGGFEQGGPGVPGAVSRGAPGVPGGWSRGRALELLTRAADKGDVEALFHLAFLEATGWYNRGMPVAPSAGLGSLAGGPSRGFGEGRGEGSGGGKGGRDMKGARALLARAQRDCKKGECFALSVAWAMLDGLEWGAWVAASLGAEDEWHELVQALSWGFSGVPRAYHASPWWHVDAGLQRPSQQQQQLQTKHQQQHQQQQQQQQQQKQREQGQHRDHYSSGAFGLQGGGGLSPFLAWDNVLLAVLSLALGVTFWLLSRLRQRQGQRIVIVTEGEEGAPGYNDVAGADAELLGGPNQGQADGLRHRRAGPRVGGL